MLAKAKNHMMRRETLFNKDCLKGGAITQADGPLLLGEPPHLNVHEKGSRDKGCVKCQLFGCAKAFDGEMQMECVVYGKPTKVRVARIGKNEKYKAKVDDYRKEKKQEALVYETTAPSTNAHPSDLLSDKEYSAMVESFIDEEDDVEAEFSMLKCSMIEAGTYYSKN